VTWLDVALLVFFSTICFLMLYLAHRPRQTGSSSARHSGQARPRRRDSGNWRQNAAVLTALITALSGLATSAVALIRATPDATQPPSTGTPDSCPESRWFKEPGERS